MGARRKLVRDFVLSWPSYNSFAATYGRLTLSRVRTLMIFAAGAPRRRQSRGYLEGLRQLQGSRSGPAVVLGSGPSARRVSQEHIENLRRQGGAVFAMNGYSRMPVASSLEPDFWVLADPAYFQEQVRLLSPNRETVESDLSYLSSRSSITTLIPHDQFDNVPALSGDSLYFNFSGLEGFTKGTNPLSPRGYAPLTALAAVSLAVYLGYGPVYLAGLDFSFLRTISVRDDGLLVLEGDHAYDKSPRSMIADARPQDFLSDIARCLKDFDLLADQHIVNWGGSDSLIDTFPRASPWAPTEFSQ